MYVDASAPVGGDGLSWAHAMRDLQDALTLANARPNHSVTVEVRVAQGLYMPDGGTHDRTRSFAVGSGVSLRGGFVGLLAGAGGDPDQNDPGRFVSVLSGDLLHNDGPTDASRVDNSYVLVRLSTFPASSIDGLTFRGAATALLGSPGVSYVIKRCTFTDNVATSSTVANPAVPNPIVSAAGYMSECRIVDNRATLAPVLAMSGMIERTTIAGNRVGQDVAPLPLPSAAIQIVGGSSSLDACLIAANTSDSLNLSTGCGVPLYNCTIVDNRAVSAPGLSGCAANIYNCIFSRNIATGGGTIQVSGYGPNLLNCFLDHGLSDVQAINGSSVVGNQTLSGSPGFVNPSGADGDPTTWADNDYRLAAGSACIDRGDSLYIPNTSAHLDILGHSPFDDPGAPNLGSGPIAIVDIGAFERGPTPCVADFDRNGVLNPTDLMVFITAWLSGDMRADVDNSGTLTSHDLLEFIGIWFVGCAP
jgi:hypothetical protein